MSEQERDPAVERLLNEVAAKKAFEEGMVVPLESVVKPEPPTPGIQYHTPLTMEELAAQLAHIGNPAQLLLLKMASMCETLNIDFERFTLYIGALDRKEGRVSGLFGGNHPEDEIAIILAILANAIETGKIRGTLGVIKQLADENGLDLENHNPEDKDGTEDE